MWLYHIMLITSRIILLLFVTSRTPISFLIVVLHSRWFGNNMQRKAVTRLSPFPKYVTRDDYFTSQNYNKFLVFLNILTGERLKMLLMSSTLLERLLNCLINLTQLDFFDKTVVMENLQTGEWCKLIRSRTELIRIDLIWLQIWTLIFRNCNFPKNNSNISTATKFTLKLSPFAELWEITVRNLQCNNCLWWKICLFLQEICRFLQIISWKRSIIPTSTDTNVHFCWTRLF